MFFNFFRNKRDSRQDKKETLPIVEEYETHENDIEISPELKKEKFYSWLRDQNKARGTAFSYSTAIDKISDELRYYGKLDIPMYAINDYRTIDRLLTEYLNINELAHKNKIGNHRYSCAIQRYSEFLQYTHENIVEKSSGKRSIEPRIIKPIQGSENEPMKIGALVRKTFPVLIEKELINLTELISLQSDEYSKITFDLNYPMLKKYDHNLSLHDNRLVGSHTRYYTKIYRITNDDYLLTSEWYERNMSFYTFWMTNLELDSL